MQSVIIVGGGVAGIAAACALADSGVRVELIEKRPMLGGRASSHVDPKSGELLDECQHGTMRCCTNLAGLLERLGVHDQIRYYDALHFLDRDGRRSVIDSCGLPAPLHTSLSFLLFKSLSLNDKIAIGRAMFAMLRAAPSPEWDAIDSAAWFAKMEQTEQAIARFWRPILVSACNEELDRISCTHAFKIFRDGFLAQATAYQFGVPRVPLAGLYNDPTIRYLKARGGSVRPHTIVSTLNFDAPAARVTSVTLQDGTQLSADCVVSALQADLLLKLLPDSVVTSSPYWLSLRSIEQSPIMGVHLWFDQAIECPPALAILDREIEWIFNKTEGFGIQNGDGDASGDEDGSERGVEPQYESQHTALHAESAGEPASGGLADASAEAAAKGPRARSYLSVVVSASRKWAGVAQQEVVDIVVAEIRACLPQARCARLLRSRVIRWPKATFSPKIGIESLRPDQRSPIANFYVAGEWTKTGWPSTMESAARSGYLAAEAVLADAGRATRFLAPSLSPSWLVKTIGRGF